MHAFVSYIGSSYNETNLNIERTVQCVPLSLNLEALENQPWRELGDDYLPTPPLPRVAATGGERQSLNRQSHRSPV